VGYAVSRKLRYASSLNSDTVRLTLSDGSLSTFIKSLKLGKMVQYQYVPSFQSALYAPKPITTEKLP
jgi:predicted transcriptional regulator